MVTIRRLKKYLPLHLTPSRFNHSIQVAKLAKRLCVHYNKDPFKGMIAGLGHDITREFAPGVIREYAAADGKPFSLLEEQNPLLLHGRASAVILQKVLGINDNEILEAVRSHVTGNPRMGVLAKIIFMADFLEPKRGFLAERYRRVLLRLPLDTALVKVLELIFDFLTEKKYHISPDSLELYNQLKEREELHEKI